MTKKKEGILIRGNRGKKSKDSVLADTMDLLMVYEPVYNRMPKIKRLHGAAVKFYDAAWDIIGLHKQAKECQETRLRCIQGIIYSYGILDASIQMMNVTGHLTDKDFFRIAEILVRIEEGVRKWKRSLPASCGGEGQREYGQKVVYPPQESPSGTIG